MDLFPALGEILKAYIGDRKAGFLFPNKRGNPHFQSNLLRRTLHPILATLGIAKTGFHAFRRFRATHLSKSSVPDALVRYWLGQANKTVTDKYIKMASQVEFRKEVAEQIGLGFELPTSIIVRNVRRNDIVLKSANAT